jgi:uncharacterized membrane protein (DUF2068 family)
MDRRASRPCRRADRDDLRMEQTAGAQLHAEAPAPPQRTDSAPQRKDRLLPWIAAERAFRAVVLLAVGIVLVSNPHANWASELTHLAQRAGLNPNGNWPRKIIEKIHKLNANEDVVFGVIALAYGALEGAEAYGLWRRRRWGEWLTVIATALLLVPEVWELTKSTTLLKVGALLVNLTVVAYLLWRLRD